METMESKKTRPRRSFTSRGEPATARSGQVAWEYDLQIRGCGPG